MSASAPLLANEPAAEQRARQPDFKKDHASGFRRTRNGETVHAREQREQ